MSAVGIFIYIELQLSASPWPHSCGAKKTIAPARPRCARAAGLAAWPSVVDGRGGSIFALAAGLKGFGKPHGARIGSEGPSKNQVQVGLMTASVY
jgi:hypothetical protein